LLGNNKAKQFSNDVVKLFKAWIKEFKDKIKAVGKATEDKPKESNGVTLCCDSGVTDFSDELSTTTFLSYSSKIRVVMQVVYLLSSKTTQNCYYHSGSS